MAYDKDKLEQLSLEAIEDNNLTNVTYVCAFIPCSKSTFYNFGLEKLDSIKDALYKNSVNKKAKLTNKWEDSENPTLQIAAFKLMADDDELDKLTSSKFDHKSGDGSMTPKSTIVTTLTQDELKEALNK